MQARRIRQKMPNSRICDIARSCSCLRPATASPRLSSEPDIYTVLIAWIVLRRLEQKRLFQQGYQNSTVLKIQRSIVIDRARIIPPGRSGRLFRGVYATMSRD